MGQKVDDLACWMGVHAGEDVGDVVDRVDSVLLAASHEPVEDGEVVTRSRWVETELSEGSLVEVVAAIGGG